MQEQFLCQLAKCRKLWGWSVVANKSVNKATSFVARMLAAEQLLLYANYQIKALRQRACTIADVRSATGNEQFVWHHNLPPWKSPANRRQKAGTTTAIPFAKQFGDLRNRREYQPYI
ncbi:TPA: hypothetical protein SMP92_004710 [Pseudomonas putida]|nr:hypothetical protein [Pseudomonas putida]